MRVLGIVVLGAAESVEEVLRGFTWDGLRNGGGRGLRGKGEGTGIEQLLRKVLCVGMCRHAQVA